MGYVTEKGRELAVSGIKGLLKKLWDESKPGLDRSGVNRFRYDAGNVRLFGRDDELAFLWKFCHSDSHFAWFAISGEGGSGKTRLAYTLGKLLKYAPGWNYRKVDYARPEGLADAKQVLKDAPQNTLLVLDYVKWHTDSIGKWLYDLWCDWHERNLKIRVLLVERDAISPRDLRWQHDVMAAQYRPVADAPFLDDNNLMRLHPLDDDDMISVVNDYATAFDAQVDAPLIIETLKKIDPQLNRPLYALFLTDALVTGEDLRTWDQSAALEYIYGKERARIQENIDLIINDKQDAEDLTDIAFHALLTAILSGGMEWNKYVQLHFGDMDVLQSLSSRAEPTGQKLLAKCLGIPYEKGNPLRIPPLEPDLMGEFFCIQELLHMEEHQQQEAIGFAMSNDLRRAAVVFDRTAHDYRQLLGDMKINRLFTEIALPNSMIEVAEGAFYGCTNLTSISLPAVKFIGENAFAKCENLVDISLPMVESVGEGAFAKCKNLVNIALPMVESIGEWTFEGCSCLQNIFFPSVKAICKCAFRECANLTDVSIPLAREIGEGAFSGCTSLMYVSVPSVEKIDVSAFSGCVTMAEISLPRIKSINIWAFYGCTNLVVIYLSDSVQVIDGNKKASNKPSESSLLDWMELFGTEGMKSFDGCTNLICVCVYGNLTDVISNAFEEMDVTFYELTKEEANTCISPPNAV